MTTHGPVPELCSRCRERAPVRYMTGTKQRRYYCGECGPSQVVDIPRLRWLPGHEPEAEPTEPSFEVAIRPPTGLTLAETGQWYRAMIAELTGLLFDMTVTAQAAAAEWEALALAEEREHNGDGSTVTPPPLPPVIAPEEAGELLGLEAETPLGNPRCQKLLDSGQCRREAKHRGHHTTIPVSGRASRRTTPDAAKDTQCPKVVAGTRCRRAAGHSGGHATAERKRVEPTPTPTPEPKPISRFERMLGRVRAKGVKTNKTVEFDKRARKEWNALTEVEQGAVQTTLLLGMQRPPKVRMNKMHSHGKTLYAWRVGNRRLRIMIDKVAGGHIVRRIVDRADRSFYHGEHA